MISSIRRITLVSLVSLLASLGAARAASGGKLVFSGSVVEMGCWNETARFELHCHQQGTILRHAIVENIATSLTAPHATVETYYLDAENQLVLLRVVYD